MTPTPETTPAITEETLGEPSDESLEKFTRLGQIPYDKVRSLCADSTDDMRELARQKDLAHYRGCYTAGRASRDAEVEALARQAMERAERIRELETALLRWLKYARAETNAKGMPLTRETVEQIAELEKRLAPPSTSRPGAER